LDEPAVLETLEALDEPPELASAASEAAEDLQPILLTGDRLAAPAPKRTGWRLPWRTRRRELPAEERPFWDVDPAPAEPDPPKTKRARWPREATIAAAAGGVAVASALLVLLLPGVLPDSHGTVAVFNAPMIVLRASGPGRITSVAVKTGQAVDPSSLLMVIRTAPKPDPTAATAQSRLEAAQQRVTALNEAIAQASLTGDAARGRGIELRRQRDAAAAELAAAQEAAARSITPDAAEQPVLAGVHGVIWSLEAQAGADTVAGAPLVRMIDCDHPFLTVANNSGLRAGDAVVVRLPDLPPVRATVRAASGVAEPPGGLVVAPAAASLPRDCPIGASATVSPVGKAA
jgi:biotin carboxyl carrier protein